MYFLTLLCFIETLVNNGQSLSLSNETDVKGTTPQNKYIIGGEVTEIESYPHQVSLQLDGTHICGGSILSANYILTAGHCVPRIAVTRYSLRAGSSYHDEGGSIHRIDHIIRNDDTNISEDKDIGDLAILHLVEPLEFDDTRKPITLLEATDKAQDNQEAVVMGWGSTVGINSPPSKQLQVVTVPIVNHEICTSAYGGRVSEGEICAGYYSEGGKDTCIRDSGGPLTIDGKLAGVTSWGRDCARPHYPGVYVNVAYYRDWIDKYSQ